MKKGIHPLYREATVHCACGNKFKTRSTVGDINVDICSNCHPFFTGEASRILDIEGQVDRFYKKLQARQSHVEAQQARESSKKSPDRPIADLELTARASEALKKGGIETVGQLLERIGQGDDAVLAIAGFGRTSLTAAKKKLRSMGFEVSETAAA